MNRALIFGIILGSSSAWACSCAHGNGTICDVFKSTKIAFIGRVIRDSGEGYGTGAGRVVVEEILHGLPPDTKELEIETDAGSSCYFRLQKDERYVILTDNWQGKLHVGGCGQSFNARGNESLLAALREAERGGEARLVGAVQQMKGTFESASGPAGIRVIAESQGKQLETYTGSGGQFEFRNIAPGSYDLRVASPGWVTDRDAMYPREPAVVAPHACQTRSLKVWPDGQVSGTIRGESGDPVADVTVQAFSFDKNDKVESSPIHEAKTDAQGHYTIHGLVAGPYIIGVNGEKYRDRSPYGPVFFGSTARETASRIEIGDGAVKSGIDLRLGAPRPAAVVTIEAVDADGRPSKIGIAIMYDDRGEQRGSSMGDEKTPGIVRLSLFQGESRFEISKFTTAGQFEGDTDFIPINAPEIHLRVVMHKKPR